VQTVEKSIVIVQAVPNEQPKPIKNSNPFSQYGQPPAKKPDPAQKDQPTKSGTGFVVEGGIIVTNAHVVEDSKFAYVLFKNQMKRHKVIIKHLDRKADIAVLVPENNQLLVSIAPLSFSTDLLRSGQSVFAIGHPLGFKYTVSTGIISSPSVHLPQDTNPFRRFVQTDTSINQGNSGGPLMNHRGEVVGVNTIIISPGRVGSIGLGFSLRGDYVQRVLNHFRNFGEIKRPRIGIKLGYNQEKERLYVMEIQPNSPASSSGILVGDLILKINADEITLMEHIFNALEQLMPNDDMRVQVSRDGVITTYSVILGDLREFEKKEALKLKVR